MNCSLGIDIGGTFTDLVVCDHDSGRQWSRKVLTTHDDPARAVVAGVAAMLAEHRLPPDRFARVVHATTLFTNALIERKGAPTGLITTAGFRDALEIGRERKFELYDLDIARPAPLVPRRLRREVAERVKADGGVKTPLAVEEAVARAGELARAGVASLAVVFLHAYANPAHEAAAARAIAARFPELHVTASHEVAAEIREYERASTAVANAYIKPLAHRYLELMARQVSAQGIPAPLLLMLSSGGLTHVAEAQRAPVRMLESGPAAGAIAAAFFGREDSGGRLLAFDMGGTTAKLSLVEDGEPLVAQSFEAARQKRFVEGSGFPIRISTVELIEIGAGGGSIARMDEIGLLKVGPESAGSQPGPASYGLGGTEPTVTDADFVLGYLNPDYFAGGTMRVDLPAARAAIERLARRMQLSPTRLAWGIHDVVDESMASAARVHIAERGRDPRDYALLCTGGAGPVHAYEVARKLGLREVICPPSAGVASALGLLVAPARVDRVATVGIRLDRDDPAALEAAFRRLEDEARAVLADTGLKLEAATWQRLADGRFLGQGFDLVVALPAGPYDGPDPAAARRALTAAFETAYREKFALTPPDVPVEFINIRVAARAPVAGGGVTGDPGRAGDLQAPAGRGGFHAVEGGGADLAVKRRRPVYFPEAGDFVETAVYDRHRLSGGQSFPGPAVVEEEGSTLVVGPGASVRVAASGNLVVTLPARADAERDTRAAAAPAAGPGAGLDAITLEVLWTRLISIVDEAAKAIVRTSFSTLSNEANDFACVLTDAEGHALAQNTGSIPSFIATLPATVRHFLAKMGADGMRPGDVLITNDAWMGTGHMSDVCVLKPLFHRGRLVAFSATTSHMPDIGGRVRAIEAREVFEEGFHIPLAKLMREGRTDETLIELLRANVRTPDQTTGDIWAQVGANGLMERRVLALLEDYGLDGFEALAGELFARAEGAMRAAIRAVPDGTYRYAMRTDGVDQPYDFRLALTVAGDEIVADYTGTSPSQPRAINCVLAYTYAMTAYAVRCALLPGLANNEGMYRPVRVQAPEGCLLNPRFPAAVVSRSNTGHYVPVLVMGALHHVIPDRVMAGTGSPLWAITQVGVRADHRPYTNVLFFNGGMGATPSKDGESATSWPSNISSTPVEVAERNSPLFFHAKRLRPGSGGDGRFRGGLGQDIVMESESDAPIVLSFMAERTRFAAPGFAGGADGGLGDVRINGEPVNHRAQHALRKGDRVLVSTPGGGGYGAPAERDPNAAARDAAEGYVSREGAAG